MMRLLGNSEARVILCALTVSLAQPASGQIRGLRISAYDIDAAISLHGDAVEVTATCSMEKTDTASQARLLLSSQCGLESVRSGSGAGSSDVSWEFWGKDTLLMRFPAASRKAGPLTLSLHYTFPISPLGDSLLLLDRGSRWYPLIPDQIATLNLRCDVPAGYTVLSAGNLQEAGTTNGISRYVWKTGLPIFKVPLVVFPSAFLKRDSVEVLDKKIVLYSREAHTTSASMVLTEAKQVFTFFTNLMGTYPCESLTLVEVPYFDGIDVSSGLLMVGSPSLEGMRKGQFDPLHLTIAQQWMGAGVFAQFGQPGFWFFTISLPHYLRLMYVRGARGEESFDAALQQPLQKYAQFAGTAADVPILDIDFPNSREKGLVLYAKGPYVVSRLHKHMGEDQWNDFLESLYQRFLGKIITYDEFRNQIVQHDGKGDCLMLWDRLMTQKGMPAD